MTDAELIGRFRNGQVSAFNTLVWRWQDRLYGFVLRYTGNREDARDLCQQVFVRAYRQLRHLRQPERFSAWLYQSALNAARDLQRQRRRHPVVSLDGGEEAASRDLPLAVTGPEQATDRRVGARDLRELLARALQGLSEEQRTVVIMKEYQELTFAEIAAVLEIPVNTAKSRLYHGLRSLRRQFEALGIGEEGLGHEL